MLRTLPMMLPPSRDERSLRFDVRRDRLGSLSQRRDIGRAAAPPFFGKRLLLQEVYGAGITGLRAAACWSCFAIRGR